MQLKILLINQQQIGQAKKIDKNLLKKYETPELVCMTERVILSEEDKNFFRNLGIKVRPYAGFGIEHLAHQKLSAVPVTIIKQFLKKIGQQKEIGDITVCENVDILSVMANEIYISYYLEFLIFTERLKYFIAENKPLEILTFGYPNLGFRSCERPDIGYLFGNELAYAPLIKETCEKFDIPLIIIPGFSPYFPLLKLKIRHFIFTTAKFLKIFGRHFLARFSIYKKAEIKNNGKKTVGVIIRADAEYYVIKPLLEKFKKEEPEIKTIILQSDMLLHPQSWKTLRTQKEEFISMYSLTSISQCLKCFIEGIIRQIKFKRALKRIKLDDYILPEGSSEEKLCAEILGKSYIAKEIFLAVSAGWAESIIFLKELKKFISENNPKALISMGMIDQWVALTSLLSNKYSIPTVSLQTASMSSYTLPSPVYANKFLVYGENMRNEMINSGADPRKIVASGAPKYDSHRLCSPEEKRRKEKQIRQELTIPEKSRILLVTTQTTDFASKPMNDELIEQALEFSQKHSDIYVIIKLHPRDPFDKYKSWQEYIKEKRLKALVIQKINVIDLMITSDVLLSRYSNTILDALILNVIPVALLDFHASIWMHELDYLRTDAVSKVKSGKELQTIFEKAFYDDQFRIKFKKDQEFFLKNSIGMLDGGSSQRAIKTIKSIL